MKFKKGIVKVRANYPKPHMKAVECYVFKSPNWPSLHLCVHKELNSEGSQGKKWVMSEMSTGLKMSKFSWQTREQAVQDGIGRMDKAGSEYVLNGLRQHLQEKEA